MKIQFKILTLIFSILFFSSTFVAKASEVKIGKPAPQFEVKTYDGKIAKLSDYAGKYIVLEWYSSVCPCCNGHYETGNMQALQNKYTKQGVVWLTVSSHAPDSQGSLSANLAKSKIFGGYKAHPTTVLLDHDGKLGTDYKATSTPHVFLINPQGVLVYKGALDNKIADGETYSPLTSRNFLAEALDAELSHQPVKVSATQPYGCDIKYAVNEYTLKN